jgi:hypothetical protein
MIRKGLLTLGLLLVWCSAALAQTAATPVPTTASSASDTNVNYFFVACEDRAVLDLDGVIQANYDVYVQVFREAGALGTPITPQYKISVNGTFQVSPPLPFNPNEKLILGQFASARLIIARETDVTRVLFETVVDEVQDGCATPSFPETAVTATGTGATAGTQVVDPATGLVLISDSGIFRPDGGMLNQVFARPQESVVQIGARPSEDARNAGRTSNPGLIFAECDQFPLANPGRLFDTDKLTVFWSWFAKTPAQVQDHINNALYKVSMNGQVFTKVSVSPIVQLGNNYWVFYQADLGDRFTPNSYGVVFELAWQNPISDGYDTFGPGTGNENFRSTCTFRIETNPYGVKVDVINPTTPLQQHLP